MSTVDLTAQGSPPNPQDVACSSAQPVQAAQPRRVRRPRASNTTVVDLTVDSPLLGLPPPVPIRANPSPAVEIIAVRRRRREPAQPTPTPKRARASAQPVPSPVEQGPRCGVCLEAFKEPACGTCGYAAYFSNSCTLHTLNCALPGMCFATSAWCKRRNRPKSVQCAKRACSQSRSSACTFDIDIW